ncbi:helix-turn-helix domain-containing protein [Streptomyces sp. NPDC001401]|uniref:helix-turn-helix domain-containing protein n=1 Tax=Streptomyces sp. NPDC001401 TaxID=3364570 RepID=UPI0036845F3A
MSQTTTVDQLAGLAPAVITVYTQLVAFTEPAAVDDIASAAGAARSSTFKALVSLEKRGLARRDRGIKNGPCRRPDLWCATAVDSCAAPDESAAQKGPVEPMTAAASPGEPAADLTDSDAVPDAPMADRSESTCAAREPEKTAAPAPSRHTERAVPTSLSPGDSLPGGKQRLAPGCLRQLVTDHLNAHPGEAFTATRISRMIDRSSGAIANALATLARQGLVEQVTDRPRTYRAAMPERTV